MRNQSVAEITSVAILSAEGGNLRLFSEALNNLQKKPPKEIIQGISSIIITLKIEGINGNFLKGAEEIFQNLK
jgi:hypothetical protein